VNTVTKTAQKTARHCKSAPSSSENHEEWKDGRGTDTEMFGFS
jgi:hypothetical protein